jgi:hypothetical protein
VSGRIPGAPTGIATAPGVDRRGRRRRYICRHALFGSECRRRSQAQRDERYASEKYPFHLNPPFQDLMSISLPGLARFGCDVSATVEGIPKFRPLGRAAEKLRIRRRPQTPSIDHHPGNGARLHSPAQAAFINQSRRLARIGAPDPRASGNCDPKIRRHASGEPRSNPSRAKHCSPKAWNAPISNGPYCGALATWQAVAGR